MAGGLSGGGGACMVGGHAWQRPRVAGAMHGGGHAWWGRAWQGDMHGRGACVAGGMRGMHTTAFPPARSYEIRSMSGRYASFWNAYLFSSRNAKKQLVPCFILCLFLDSFYNFFIFYVNITESGNLIEKKQFRVTN